MRGKPHFILFDAAGTLIRSVPDVPDVYHRFGERYGTQFSRDEIGRRFRHAFQDHAGYRPGDDLRTDDDVEWSRWRQIVGDVFSDVHEGMDELFVKLWDHFAASGHWQLHGDVAPIWRWLQEQGYSLGIASNFDRRLHTICSGLQPLSDCRWVFASAEVGYRKPSADFFRRIEGRLQASADDIMLVGDDLEADWRAASAAGWNAVYLDRQRTSNLPHAIHDLSELQKLLATTDAPARKPLNDIVPR